MAATTLRVKLIHLDSNISEVLLTIPRCSEWSSYEEDSALFLNDYIGCLASKWIKIRSCFIEMGALDNEGNFIPAWVYREVDIPLNMIYKIGMRGEWIPLKDAIMAEGKGGAKRA